MYFVSLTRWETGDWGPCSATCGPSVQSRPAFCVQGGPNGSRIDVKSEFCPVHKPQTERSCMIEECPRWFQGAWTPVRFIIVIIKDTSIVLIFNCLNNFIFNSS